MGEVEDGASELNLSDEKGQTKKAAGQNMHYSIHRC